MYEIKIPNTIKIGGFDYKITHNKERNIELEDTSDWGTHSTLKREICLRTDCPPQQKSSSFIHECLHAIDEVYLAKGINDERLIKGLANGLLQLFEQLEVRFVKE